MKHIAGRFYYQPPFFIGIMVKSWARAIVYNAIGLLLTVGIVIAVIKL